MYLSDDYIVYLLYLFFLDETGSRPISTQPSTCFLANRPNGNARNNNNIMPIKPERMDGPINGINPYGQMIHTDKEQAYMSNHLHNLSAMTQVSSLIYRRG